MRALIVCTVIALLAPTLHAQQDAWLDACRAQLAQEPDNEGLGHLIVISSANIQTDLTFAAILTLAIIGVVLFALIGVIERFVAPWQKGIDHHVATA